MSPRQGLLLVNLGTPDAPETPAVRRYLREFLSDARVLDIPAAARWALLELVILPRRPARSAEAYRKVWMAEGSPLLVHGRALAARLREALGPTWAVELGMRYGQPSLHGALSRLAATGVEALTVLPLYPQYASSSTGSSLELIYRLSGRRWNTPALRVVPPFFGHPGFLDAWEQVARPALAEARADHVVFSFHGLPERQVQKSDPSGSHCLRSPSCCDLPVPENRFCYRHQCFTTARALSQRLGLSAERTTVSFQSRLGRTPWLKPYTDLLLPELVKRGVRRLAVLCPAFVADCLETLEEIGIRAEADFRRAGGEALTLVPSLNAHPAWVRAVTALVGEAAPPG
ncbi:MAG TPA: ferrochelatase [Myxococcaceae bacterium]|nr:ferrochelatase [Myxococcaceae bacterium]